MLARTHFLMPDTVTFPGLAGGFLVPGLAIYLRNPGRSGKAALAVCALLLLVFFVFLGFPVANAAFTLLLCIHVVGFVAYCSPLLAGSSWTSRLVASLLLCVATIVLVYLPLQNMFERHLFIPVRLRGHVIVVRCFRSPAVIHRGEWIAYRVSMAYDSFNTGAAHGSVLLQDGINLAPVLAVQGDHIQFTPQSFSVNGVAQPRQKYMPVSGELTVPENCLFAWTDMNMDGHGNVPESNITAVTMQVATVHREQFIGKAFHHWFWRRQLLA